MSVSPKQHQVGFQGQRYGQRNKYNLLNTIGTVTPATAKLVSSGSTFDPTAMNSFAGSAHRPNHKQLHKDPMQQFKVALNNIKGGPAKSKFALDAIDNVKGLPNADKLTKAIVGATLSETKGAERAQFMGDFAKSSPSKGVEMLAEMKPELTSLKGQDLSSVPKETIQALPINKIQLAGATLPPNVDFSNKNLDGANLDGVKAPGLIVLGAKGTFSAKGAEFGGGAINSSDRQEFAAANTAILIGAGAKVPAGHVLTDLSGERQISVPEATNQAGGLKQAAMPPKVKQAPSNQARFNLMSGPSFG